MRDPGSPTRERTCAPLLRKHRVLTHGTAREVPRRLFLTLFEQALSALSPLPCAGHSDPRGGPAPAPAPLRASGSGSNRPSAGHRGSRCALAGRPFHRRFSRPQGQSFPSHPFPMLILTHPDPGLNTTSFRKHSATPHAELAAPPPGSLLPLLISALTPIPLGLDLPESVRTASRHQTGSPLRAGTGADSALLPHEPPAGPDSWEVPGQMFVS